MIETVIMTAAHNPSSDHQGGQATNAFVAHHIDALTYEASNTTVITMLPRGDMLMNGF